MISEALETVWPCALLLLAAAYAFGLGRGRSQDPKFRLLAALLRRLEDASESERARRSHAA